MRYCILLTALLGALNSYAQLNIPAQSPLAILQQNIGLTEVEITYSRPSTRGRTIFGKEGLLPDGEVWRMGANAATKFEISRDIMIDNQLLKKGSYAILSTPGPITWQINFYEYNESNWNSYLEKSPTLRLIVSAVENKNFIETLEIRFQSVTMNSATLLIEWEHVSLRIPIEVEEQEYILKSISRTLEKPSSFDYYRAALYLHETQTDLNRALDYITQVTSSKDALFFQVTREALILKDLKKNVRALKSADRALKLSKASGIKDFIRLNQKLIAALKGL